VEGSWIDVAYSKGEPIASEASGLKPTRGQKYRSDMMRCWS
jgi:hypothetical protein